MTASTEMLEQKPTLDLLEILSVCCKPGSESYRDIVKELWRREGTEGGGSVLDIADDYRDELFRQAYDFRRQLDDTWDRLLKTSFGDAHRDHPCPICHPDWYRTERGWCEAKLDPPVDDAAEKAGKEVQ